ncbi:F-box/LRR-repeat protein 12-like [Ptychodera flava]|uniref:F-box/LRR-repeat protein 12-like n=1 Tax=Ptychodera flava TaxID=63121 RepID=UPI003969F8BD
MAGRGAARAAVEEKSKLLSDRSLCESPFGKLPDNIILEIFYFLDPRDMCRIARVCKTWNRLINDKLLWRHVDLRNYRVDLRSVWKVIRNHFSSTLLSLKLKGFLHSVRKTECLSNAVLQDLKERCPNLSHLEIMEANFNSLDASTLPSSLTSLVLQYCELPKQWFKDLSTDDSLLPKLQCLDLSFSTRISQADLKDICNRPLRELKLNGCYRINDTGIQHIAETLQDLEVLELAQCDITDLSLHHISRHLKKLDKLNLADCNSLTETGVPSLSLLKNLRWLSLAHCNRIVNTSLLNLAKSLKLLKYLDISDIPKAVEVADDIRCTLPDCEIVSENIPVQ